MTEAPVFAREHRCGKGPYGEEKHEERTDD